MARHITERHSTKPKLSCPQCSRRQGFSITFSSLPNLIFPSYKRPHNLKEHFQKVHNGSMTLTQRAKRTDKDIKPTLKSISSQASQLVNAGIILHPFSMQVDPQQPVGTTLSPQEEQHYNNIYVRRYTSVRLNMHHLTCSSQASQPPVLPILLAERSSDPSGGHLARGPGASTTKAHTGPRG